MSYQKFLILNITGLVNPVKSDFWHFEMCFMGSTDVKLDYKPTISIPWTFKALCTIFSSHNIPTYAYHDLKLAKKVRLKILYNIKPTRKNRLISNSLKKDPWIQFVLFISTSSPPDNVVKFVGSFFRKFASHARKLHKTKPKIDINFL